MSAKKILFSVFVLVVLSISFYSCDRFRDHIALRSKNFVDVVSLRQNLVFTFSGDVVPDSMLNKWIDKPLIRFSPEVPGRFKYTSSNELVFSPLAGFKPGTAYTATLQADIVDKQITPKPLGSDRKLTFQTPMLSAERLDLFWTSKDPSRKNPLLRATITFNYPIDPQLAYTYLSMELDGKAIQTRRSSGANDRQLTVWIDGLDPKKVNGQSINATLREGLPCLPCTLPTKETMELGATIADINRIDILEVRPLFEANEAYLEIKTNQEIDPKRLSQALLFEPAVTFTTETTWDGVRLKGDFQAGSTYELSINTALEGRAGGRLAQTYTTAVSFGEMEPTIRFASNKGFYLGSRGSKTIGVQIINVPTVRVKVYKIYENNLLAYISAHRSNYYYESSSTPGTSFGSFSYDYWSIEKYGDLVMERDYQTNELVEQDGIHLLTFDLNDTSKQKGVYLVQVQSANEQWLDAWRMISYSDIGLIVKSIGNETVVFAHSIFDTSPLEGVEINLISQNNQWMKSGVTDAEGMVRIGALEEDAKGFTLGMVTAKTEQDYNVLLLNDTRVETSRFDVGGQARNESGFMAYVYAERDLYRPGETIHLNTILRDPNWGTPDQVPVVLRVRLPNGREWISQQKTTSAQGSASFDLPLDPAAVTGTYVAELYTSDRVLLNTLMISVEEFMPDRIKVQLSTNATRYALGSAIQAKVKATNLYGPPAAGRNAEVGITYQRQPFTPKGYERYLFDIHEQQEVVLETEFRQGQTTPEGEHEELFMVPEVYADMGLLNARLFATVFDESGRPVNQLRDVTIQTQQVFFGMQSLNAYVDVFKSNPIAYVALDANGKPVPNARATISIVRLEWKNVLERNYDDQFRYVSQKQEVLVSEREVILRDGSYTGTFQAQQSGEYEIRIRRPGASSWVAQTVYAYGYGFTGTSSFEVDTDGAVTIETEKASYKTGETARILFKTPFSGRLIVTIERDHVMEHYTMMTDKKAAVLELPIDDAHVPNIYVTATLLKPLTDQSVPITTAHGVASISVEKPKTRLPIKISAAPSSRSNRKQTIKVLGAGAAGVEMSIAVVDEGILQITNYASPNPFGYFYAKRALHVTSYDVYPYVFPDLMRRSSTGGDGYDLSLRVNPMGNRRSRLISYWSGVVKTNASGEASFDIYIPSFSGSLRVMAVAWKAGAFGQAEHRMTVADPIVIQTAVPRFLSPGDSLDLGLILANTTAKDLQATATVKVSGPVQLSGGTTRTISLGKNAEQSSRFGLIAQNKVGEARISVSVKSGGETFVDTVFIPVRPSAGLVKRNGFGTLSLNSTTFNPGKGFLKGSATAKVVVSRSPLVQFTKQLQDLIAYPYGCAEQTVSAAFPQLYYEELAAMMTTPTDARRTKSSTANVQEAIRKLETMQLYNGSISYWPGGTYENRWASIYAAHFFLEARKAGFEVKQDVLQRLLWYVESQTKLRSTERYTYRDAQGKQAVKTIASKDLAYGLYVLALAGQPDLPSMNYYKDNTALLAIDSRYLLAAAFLKTGNRSAYTAILPKAFSGEQALTVTGGSMYSFLRDQGIVLNTLLEVDPKNTQIAPLSRQVSEQLSKAPFLSTQEAAFALLAMGKVQKMEAGNQATAVVSRGSGNLGTFTGQTLNLPLTDASVPITIAAKGKGRIYYFWDTQGLWAEEAVPGGDQVLKVRRTYLNRQGQELQGSTFRQNDLIVVRLSLQTLDGSLLENVVVSDILPAGFELENPRLGSVPELGWIADAGTPDHMDLRDDRIHFFTTASGTPTYFYYMVRAVSPGRFKVGLLSADAMYNGNYHSYYGSGSIQVLK